MRDMAEKQYGKVPSGDKEPNSWTLLDFGKSLLFRFRALQISKAILFCLVSLFERVY